MAEIHCRNHKGITGMICEMAGSCPLGGASSDQNKHSFSYVGKGTTPKSPAYGNVYRAPTEAQRRVAESSETKKTEDEKD